VLLLPLPARLLLAVLLVTLLPRLGLIALLSLLPLLGLPARLLLAVLLLFLLPVLVSVLVAHSSLLG
jgi:hypothetical protein